MPETPHAHRNEPCPCGSGLKYKKCCLDPKAAGESSHPAEELRVRAYAEMGKENWPEAIDLFKSYMEHADHPGLILDAIGACYDAREEYLTAAEYYEKAVVESDPTRHADLHYRLGVARACAERTKKAVDAFERAYELRDDLQWRQNVSDILRMLDEIQEGKMASNFFFIQVQFQRFNHEMENEQFDQACARMERMRDLDPANPVIFYNLGIVYTFLKLDDKALDAFTRCVQIEPGLHQAWYNMGQLCLLGKRDPSRALHCFDRVVSRDPSHISGHAQRATALELLGDKARAVESWRKVLELQPEHKEAQKNIERLTQAAV